MTKPDFPQGICAGMRYTVSMTKPLAETAFDGLVMVSKTSSEWLQVWLSSCQHGCS